MKFLLKTVILLMGISLTCLSASSTDKTIAGLCDSLLIHLPDSAGITRLAVLPFEGNSSAGQDGRAVAELIVSQLARQHRFTLVDRADFQKMLAEIELSQSDLVDESMAVKAGAMLAADAVLVGSITEVLGSLRISAKIIRTQTTEILSGASVVVAPVALDALTKEIVGEKNQASSALFRSMVVPGWGQFYAHQYTRGALCMVAFVGAGAGTAYLGWQTGQAKQEWKDYAGYIATPAYWADVDSVEALRGITHGAADTLLQGKRDDLYDAYSKNFDRAVILGVITGCVWALNLVDAAIAGAQAKRRFRPYFSAGIGGEWSAGMALTF